MSRSSRVIWMETWRKMMSELDFGTSQSATKRRELCSWKFSKCLYLPAQRRLAASPHVLARKGRGAREKKQRLQAQSQSQASSSQRPRGPPPAPPPRAARAPPGPPSAAAPLRPWASLPPVRPSLLPGRLAET